MCIYGVIGVFGTIGILGRSTNIHPPQTIINYFEEDAYPPFIIELIFLVHLVTTYPLFCYLSKH